MMTETELLTALDNGDVVVHGWLDGERMRVLSHWFDDERNCHLFTTYPVDPASVCGPDWARFTEFEELEVWE